jgi:teichoic acid transport system ATP-binding protein
MSDDHLSAIIEDLHVTYRTYVDPMQSIRNLALGSRRNYTEVHAVRGVDLTLSTGEFFGIVGKNGSGKSTLLQAMTGLLPVDKGRIRVKSRPRFLGVGAVLRPGLSGRRNVIIGGLALGIARQTIEERLEEVVDFIDIGEAIDRPMRTYSSGQKARIGFAVATLSPPDILLVDEALVVGDASFRSRSQERMDEILAGSGTVVLVSHNVIDIAERCGRAIWLDEGIPKMLGPAAEVVEAYLTDSGVPGLIEGGESFEN